MEAFVRPDSVLEIADLQEIIERYRLILTAMREGVVVQSADGPVISANASACRILGLSVEEVMGRTSFDSRWLAVREDGTPLSGKEHPAMLCLLLGQPIYDFTMGVHHPDGALTWISVNAVPLFRGKEATPYAVVTTFVDVTERRQAEEERQRLMEEIRTTIKKMPNLVFRAQRGPDGIWRLVFNEGELAEEFGVATNLVKGRQVAEVHPAFGDEVLGTFDAVLAEGGAEYTTRIGSRYFLNVAKRTLVEKINGVLCGEIVGFVADITERHQAEQQLRLAAAVYQNMLEAIVVTDVRGSILSVNPAFTTLTGFSADDAIGENVNILKSGRHHPRFYQQIWLSLKENRQWQGEIWNRRRNGELFSAWLNINAIDNEKGQVMYYVGVLSDITARKRYEAQIRRQAFYDNLTDLPNRLLLQDRLNMALLQAKRSDSKVAVLFLDLDSFKAVNDLYGHCIGDQVLKAAASQLKGCVRRTDTIARLGGDEFVIVLPQLRSTEGAALVAQKALIALDGPLNIKPGMCVTSSIGISVFPDDCEDAEALMRKADQAMYQAKEQGKNCFRFCR